MDEDYFEQEFEDELAALNEMETEANISSSDTKRSLFIKSTPKRRASLNDSFPQELEQTPDQLEKKQRLSESADITPSNENKKRRISVGVYEADDDLAMAGGGGTRYPEIFSQQASTSTITVTPKITADNRKRVLRRIPKGEFMPVTATDGVRSGYMVVAKDTEQLAANVTNVTHAKEVTSRHLLATDFQMLKEQVERKRTKKALDALNQMKEVSATLESDLFGDEDASEESVVKSQNQRLWVDLYSPKLYIDLMSDEAVNRVLLRWVKMWDYVVFKKQRPLINRVTVPSTTNNAFNSTATRGGKGRGKRSYQEFFKKKYDDLGLEEEFDKLYRPVQKVVLLCGKPGLGKTTLAHVVARHAGYNVIEMNASDERSAQSFKDKIEDSLTMRPLLGTADPRPNCLIIDEIDGAPAPAINALLSKISTTGGTNEEVKKKKPQESPLLRPIICICNDLYTPALRPLRQHALVLSFPSQCPSLLAARLLEICKYESLHTDMSTLMALCRKSSSDIRSCLNTLQFIRRRRSDLTMKELMGMGVGAKDEQKSLFNFWQQVFQMPSKSRSVMPSIYDESTGTTEDDNSLSGRFEKIYREAQACGEFNRLVQGLHENFLNMKYKDCFMRSIIVGMDWLTFTDHVNKRILSQQAFNLYGYLPFLSVVFHLLFSQSGFPKIVYPKTEYEMVSKRNQMNSLVTTLCQNVLPNVYQHVNSAVLSVDILPLLVDVIIQPSMRPVNIQLYSANEKAMLKEMVQSMIAYNLTYSQHKSADGAYSYTLEPPVDELIRFPDIRQTRKALSYTAKQLIANEVQQEKQRRLDKKSTNPSTPTTKPSRPDATPQRKKGTPTASTPTSHTPSRVKARIQDMLTPNHKHKLAPKNITPSQKEATDFFGRPVDTSARVLSADALQAQKDTALLHTDIWYQFKQGFSNAVRKKVTINDLL